MLGKIVRVRVTAPMNSVSKRFGYTYELNFGIIEGGSSTGNCVQFAYIMGVSHPRERTLLSSDLNRKPPQ